MHNLTTVCIGIFLCTFLSPLFASNIQKALEKNLHENSNWITLLHYKFGSSEIDDKLFFLSPEGKKDPKKELIATIKAFEEDTTNDDNSTACLFPARMYFLIKNGIDLPQKSCYNIQNTIDKIAPKSLTISYPAAHINSPASMFGHTLLKINGEDNSSLIANAINYSAITSDTNGFVFAFKGVFGGYEGRYSIVPYYKKIQEYNGAENRDIWEYELNFTPEETYAALLHTIEISRVYSDYFFFNQNCSYNILWILQFGKDSKVNLVKNFNVTATPIQTIRELEKNNLIKSSTYRYSKMKLIETIFSQLKDKELATNFIKNNYDEKLLEKVDIDEKIKILDVASNDLMIKYIRGDINKDKYLPKFIKVLKQRSQTKQTREYSIKTPANPLSGDLPNKIGFGLSEEYSFIFYHPTYHDIYDIEKGFISGAYITFFDFEARKENKKDKKLFLQKVSFLNIRSYATRSYYHKPISWEVGFEAYRLKGKDLYGRLKAGAGLTYGNEDFFGYFMTNLSAIANKKENIEGISPKIGFIINYFPKCKIGGWFEKSFYAKNIQEQSGEVFFTFYLNKSFNITTKYEKQEFKIKENLSLSLSYKF